MPPVTLKDRLLAFIGEDGLVLGREAGVLVGVDPGAPPPGSGDMEKATYDPNEDGVIALGQGGTGATTAAGARAALELGTAAVEASGAFDAAGAAAAAQAAAEATAAAALTAHAAAADPHTGYQRESERAAANGYASLDGGTKVPIAQVPTGQTGTTVPLGDDARFSDARTPTAHAVSHKTGGSDPIALDTLAAPTDVTTLNADTAKHGLCPKFPGGTTTFLRADGSFAAPPGGGGGVQVARKDADQTGIGTSATDVSGLSVAVASGQRIRFKAFLLVRTSATTIGGMVSVNGPAASLVSFERFEWTSATVRAAGTMATALDAFAAQSAGPGATTVLYEIRGFAKFSASGTFVVRAKAESGGTMSVLEGSWLEYDLA